MADGSATCRQNGVQRRWTLGLSLIISLALVFGLWAVPAPSDLVRPILTFTAFQGSRFANLYKLSNSSTAALPKGSDNQPPVLGISSTNNAQSENSRGNDVDELQIGQLSSAMDFKEGRTSPSQKVDDSSAQVERIPIFYYMTEIKAAYLLLLNVTASFNRGALLYIVTSTDAPEESSELLKDVGAHVHVVEPESIPDIETFRKHYIHRSSNLYEYERMCFERFFILREVARSDGIESLVYSDADIALFADILDSPFANQDTGFVSITQWSTYFGVWRLETLEQFCTYMLWFYQRPEAEVLADLAKFGERIHTDEMDESSYVIQFSDMFLLSAFLKTQAVSQTILEENAEAMRSLLALENPRRLQPAGDDSYVCESAEHFDSYLDWRMTPNGVLAPYHEDTLLIGIHFQGQCKEEVVPHVLHMLFPDPNLRSGDP